MIFWYSKIMVTDSSDLTDDLPSVVRLGLLCLPLIATHTQHSQCSPTLPALRNPSLLGSWTGSSGGNVLWRWQTPEHWVSRWFPTGALELPVVTAPASTPGQLSPQDLKSYSRPVTELGSVEIQRWIKCESDPLVVTVGTLTKELGSIDGGQGLHDLKSEVLCSYLLDICRFL